MSLIELCEENGVRIFVTTHGRTYDPANARDRRSLQEDAVDSEYESAKTSARIQRNVRAAAERGRPHGKNLYGYKRIYDEQTRTLVQIVPHPEQAPVVRKAARLTLQGKTSYAIAKEFNAEGIPPRREVYREHRKTLGWTAVAIVQMLRQPAYTGLRQHRGVVVSEAIWPPLIDRDDWEKIQAIFASRKRDPGRDWTARHLLGGIAVCAECGMALRLGKQNRGRKRYDEDGEPLPREHYLTYVCSGAPGKSGFHVAIKQDHLDQMVTQLVLARAGRADFLATIGQKGQGVDRERQELLDEIRRYQIYLDEVRAKAAENLRFDLVLDQEVRVMPKIKEAQRRLDALTEVDPVVLELARSDQLAPAWESMPLETKRRVIRALMVPTVKRSKKPGRRGPDVERLDPGWR